jgi:hypothetical protein
MSSASAEAVDVTKHKKHDNINRVLIIMIKIIFIIIIVKQLPDDLNTLRGITITIFTVGVVLALFDLLIPDIIHPVRETFFFMVGMKILRM